MVGVLSWKKQEKVAFLFYIGFPVQELTILRDIKLAQIIRVIECKNQMYELMNYLSVGFDSVSVFLENGFKPK
jgi:hypothetical protein